MKRPAAPHEDGGAQPRPPLDRDHLARGDRLGGLRRDLRRRLGRSILLGLEFLIIADIVLTITVDPTLESALALGLIVLVRTFLSFSLEIELEGAPPWRRAAVEKERGTDRVP